MSFPYYQQAQPGWGTMQYQFGPPPVPNFQVQPSWGGMDFYRAHAYSADPTLFDHAWSRVRDQTGLSSGIGVGLHEARHWHHRAYGGIGELSRMHPAEIGHAAAYEAYRTWIHNSWIYEPLNGDPARQREALIGLAVAEATRLLQYANRPLDEYTRLTASDAAAYTASIIFYQSREEYEEEFRSRPRHRYSSGSSYGDPYAYDDAIAFPHLRSRSHHLSRSLSRHRTPPPASYAMQIPSVGYASSMPGTPFSSAGYPSSIPPGMPSSYGSYGSYAGTAMSVGSAYPSAPMQLIPSGGHRSRSISMSYGQSPYIGTPMATGVMMPAVPQPQAIIVTKPRRKHRHHHHHHHHHSRSRSRRSRGSEPDDMVYGY